VAELLRYIEGDPQDHAEKAWRTLLALLHKGPEMTIVFTDPVFGQTVVDVWKWWAKVVHDFRRIDSQTAEFSLKKPFILAFQRNWDRRDKLKGPITMAGLPQDYTREVYTYTVTGSTIAQTSVEIRPDPYARKPGDGEYQDLTKDPQYQALLQKLGKGSRRYDAYDPAVPGSQHRPDRPVRLVQFLPDPTRPEDPEPAAPAVPGEPDGGDPAERGAHRPAVPDLRSGRLPPCAAGGTAGEQPELRVVEGDTTDPGHVKG
jgi:hypothetical protein